MLLSCRIPAFFGKPVKLLIERRLRLVIHVSIANIKGAKIKYAPSKLPEGKEGRNGKVYSINLKKKKKRLGEKTTLQGMRESGNKILRYTSIRVFNYS